MQYTMEIVYYIYIQYIMETVYYVYICSILWRLYTMYIYIHTVYSVDCILHIYIYIYIILQNEMKSSASVQILM